MLLIVFIDQHCKPESNILLIRVQGDRNSLPAYGLAEMNVEIPIKDTQQVQYGFPPESGIVRTVPKINCTTEAKKSLNLTPSQPNLEILPHIKEKIRSNLPQATHGIQEHRFIYFEKSHREIGTYLTD